MVFYKEMEGIMLVSLSKSDLGDIFHSVGVEWDQDTGDFCRASLAKHIITSHNKVVVAERAIKEAIAGYESIGLGILNVQAYNAYSFLQASLFHLHSSKQNYTLMSAAIDGESFEDLIDASFDNGMLTYYNLSDMEAADYIMSVFRLVDVMKNTIRKALEEGISLAKDVPVNDVAPWLATLGAALKYLTPMADDRKYSMPGHDIVRAIH